MVNVKTQHLKLKINNKTYGEFDGFEINFHGFNKLPYRMSSPNGSKAGKYLPELLIKGFGEFDLTVVKDQSSKIDDRKKPI